MNNSLQIHTNHQGRSREIPWQKDCLLFLVALSAKQMRTTFYFSVKG